MANIEIKDNVFWLYEPSVLFRNNNYIHFIPNGQNTFVQNLNSITLFCIYLAIILLILFPNKSYVCIPIIVIIISIFVYFLFADSHKQPKIQPDELKAQKVINEPFKEISLSNNTTPRQFFNKKEESSDNKSFAQWLYQTPETCKENPSKCLRYEDVRYSRYSPTIDLSDSESENSINI